MGLEVLGPGFSRGHIWEGEPVNRPLSQVQLRICEPSTQPRCARRRSRLCRAKPCTAARWRHNCSSACRPGPLQIRVCGKRGGAETRPGRGEDGPAGQTDRGPGGRRAAQRSHVPPWIRRQPGPGLPTCPPGRSGGSGPGGTGDPDSSVLNALAASGASSSAGAPIRLAFRTRGVASRGFRTAGPLLCAGFTAGSVARGRLCLHMGRGGEGKGRGAGGRGWQGRCPGTARRLAAGRVGRRLGAATATGREAGSGCGRR